MLKRTPEDAAVLVSFVNKSTNPMPSNLFKMTPSDVFFRYCVWCKNIWTQFDPSENFYLSLWLSTLVNTQFVGIYLFKFRYENNRTMCEICSKLTINTPEPCQWQHSSIFIVNFIQISHILLVFPSLSLNR